MKLNKFLWVYFVSRRFANVDMSGRSALASRLASLGICFGVMTLIAVLSVMNGFQMSFIDAIMEVSSYHVRIENVRSDLTEEFENYCGNFLKSSKHKSGFRVKTLIPFYESQSFIVGNASGGAAALIRALPENVFELDEGFEREVNVIRGEFDLSSSGDKDLIVLGSSLASKLGVRIGNTVNLLALSGGNDVEMLSSKRIFTVAGIFHTGYAGINSGYAFIGLNAGEKYFGSQPKKIYGIKLFDQFQSESFINEIKSRFLQVKAESWKSYNRSFFGALRVEKNMLMLFVFLIFVVVCINIFNSMKRMVYERRNEISILSALGGKNRMIQAVFIFRGFLTGVTGAFCGLALGLLLSVQTGRIFKILSFFTYGIQYFFTMLFSPENAAYLHENPMYLVYAGLPARIFMHEVLIITVFGIFSSLAASWLASMGILKLKAAEVLRDE
ncbi:ABC transporter permease [Treponema parvum]|uniref:ABC transporter permease n=1 Tax=Treponema parvum TaxID=138851 RepID=A0A975F4A5_9SPIR|nr:ABC transporter permease [Treponema parvum]QTQ13764.1 ABC transporter permease [Treponema parvum]